MKKIKNVKSAMVGLFALGIIGVGAAGSLAYLTDAEQHVNKVTVGDVKMDLTEENWHENDAKDAVPNEVIAKDPMIINSGVNDEIVFMTVEVPLKNVSKVKADGSGDGADGAFDKKLQEIFYFQKSADAGKQANSFNLAADGADGWRLIGGTTTAGVVSGDKAVYTFAYNRKLEGSTAYDGSTQTAENKQTSKLFDKVQMKNVLETELTKGETENIVVTAYAIQASDIVKNDNAPETFNANERISDTDLGLIWNIVGKQGTHGDGNTGTAIPEADHHNTLDLNGGAKTDAPAQSDPQNPNH